MKTAVLGAGSWGTALAVHLAKRGRPVSLWGRDAAALGAMQATRQNARYLPGGSFPEALTATASLPEALAGAGTVLVAVPSEHLRAVAQKVAPVAAPGVTVICATKGLEADTCLTMDAVLADAWPGAQVALLSGPTFAAELVRGLPAAAVVASRRPEVADAVQAALASDLFRVYTSDDVVGVALGGAVKNVMAIAVGFADGLGFGDNARAALITRGLAEVGRLGARMGAHPLTLAGLAGLGDLVLTCTGELSRNRRLGLALARGETLASGLAHLGQVAEGVVTARTARRLAESLGVDMPITGAVASVLHDGVTPSEALAVLMAREAGFERA